MTERIKASKESIHLSGTIEVFRLIMLSLDVPNFKFHIFEQNFWNWNMFLQAKAVTSCSTHRTDQQETDG